ncbi:polysaccharide deacetylase family protein [Methylomusa anaerophila]|uniref:polysaccharide deacetylase family protein n=1 Tax=Methylomusa anaerophila TaxID=1930071 RepID=UPI001E343689|nr:polysaccharide deacetylase family protein [Methylomusa anaerophila]
MQKCMLSLAAAASISYAFNFQPSQAANDTLPILLYHRIGPETDALTISPSRFKSDLQYLHENGYNTLTLAAAKDHLSGVGSITGKPVLITFDDGYLDNYANAFPLLQSFSMTASFFIITGMLDQPNRMTMSQLLEMSAAGMSFGSHTVSHRPLGNLSPAEMSQELENSKAALEDLLGKAVDSVAYPRGSYNLSTLYSSHELGYRFGLTTNTGYANSRASQLALNRIPVFRYDQPLAELLRYC